ncbi:S8 family serine peptidase [Streptomyces griseiscabiei]|uniref:S8 family serine peptidase n=1 Tax=Streptomyces griseiscabiei TaxID=2993540 RepID=A0ABU4KWF3_9ACTN|nr:S8 family serine peptidase [Streptomyces griseiscabiei]MBZ3903399.1 S8 family serine peptidase [Streptomyces griseiscabiei]MDX2907712.1 S8 family serine peptidase [Streptomyces griseiscabiei]
MDRAELLAVFYGEGPVPVLWATDCPVHFDVWLAFAGPPTPAPAAPPSSYRQDLILAVREEYGVERALERLRRLRLTEACRPVAAGSFVVAQMTLEELVTALLPLTNLAGVVRVSHELAVESGTEGIEKALQGHIRAPATSEIHDNMQRRQERGRHLTWFLNLLHRVMADAGPDRRDAREVTAALVRMLADAVPDASPVRGAHSQVGQVVDRRQKYPVVSVTTNRRASRAVVRSRRTIKADAAEQVFSVDTASIGWAVVDSGIDARHSAFHEWDTTVSPPRRLESRIARSFDFTCVRAKLPDDALVNGLVNWSAALPSVENDPAPGPPAPGRPDPYVPPGDQHGTHIAGIIGGWWPELEFRGICPRIRLYDFRVLNDDGEGDEFSIVTALQAVRHINEQAGRFVIAGVNLSLSVPHDVATHSTGWTPVCVECDRLTRSGVVVVTAAGNAGFSGAVRTLGTGYHDISISDPGNAESVITVGSTHRSNPHRHGVSHFSSRGPTGDGRPKPDLVAPGEDIDGPIPGEGIAAMHGTSQAAAHVSGAAAMLLARYRELLGRPERVKEILCATATDLARERDFQGHGLVDVLRAMQSV